MSTCSSTWMTCMACHLKFSAHFGVLSAKSSKVMRPRVLPPELTSKYTKGLLDGRDCKGQATMRGPRHWYKRPGSTISQRLRGRSILVQPTAVKTCIVSFLELGAHVTIPEAVSPLPVLHISHTWGVSPSCGARSPQHLRSRHSPRW